MRTLVIHSQKGGSGRSTLAVNLAVEAERSGLRVAVIDLDPQCSAASWLDRREAQTPIVTSVTPARLAKALQTIKNAHYDLALIDTAPHSADAAIMAAEASDVMIIPCQPWAPDLETLPNTARIVALVKKPAYVVISQAPLAPKHIASAMSVARDHGLEVSPSVIYRRAAVAHSQTLGLAACEFAPGSKAASDMAGLYLWLAQMHIDTNAHRHNRAMTQMPMGLSTHLHSR